MKWFSRHLSLRRVVGSFAAVVSLCAGAIAVAAFSNGGFETGDLTGWTVTAYNHAAVGSIASPPEDTLRANLGLSTSGSPTDESSVVSGSQPESEFDPQLGSGASLRFPLFGTNSARVNYKLTSSQNANSLKQSFTVTTADIDTLDNKAHVRFAVAPVLKVGSHTPGEQAFFFVNVTNVTKSSNLYHSFKYANQPGVPWKTGTIDSSYKYTDWQVVDVSPGAGALDVGDTVEVEIIASRCQPSGHTGYVYVDGFGAFLPGLSVVASGPESANENSDITYTYTYRNGSSGPVSNATMTIVLPSNVTYVSKSAGGATCTTPSSGGTGTVSCNLGTLPKDAVGTMTVTVHINPSFSGTIGHGNYAIHSDQSSALLGPLVNTVVTSGITYADLAVAISNGAAAIGWGQSTQYNLVVTNNGPSAVTGATVAYTPPAQLTGVTWTCSGTGGATCPASGTATVNNLVNIPVGSSVIFVIDATVTSGSGTTSITHTATVTPPGGVQDNYTANNTGVDTETLGNVATLTVTKNVAGGGSVTSAPASISCGTSCSSDSGDFLDGASVTLSSVAATNFVFTGWSGGGCSGTGSCTTVLSGATSISANFDCATSGYYGSTCTSQCPGGGNCSAHGTCDDGVAGDGTCTCAAGYAGAACDMIAGADSDSDGIPDSTEGGGDFDGDGVPNYLDLDSDDDGILDSVEGILDTDSDGASNYLDGDSDGDGIRDVIERAVSDSFVGTSGVDANTDGIDDAFQTFPTVDTDSDATPDYKDLDSDGDGQTDAVEAFDLDGNGTVDVTPSGVDADADGVDDAFQSYTTPQLLSVKWRTVPSSSPGADSCKRLNLATKLRKVSEARAMLVTRAQKFSDQAKRCGRGASALVRTARTASSDIAALVTSSYGGVVYVCPKTACTKNDLTRERDRLQRLGVRLGTAAKAAKLKAMAVCPRAPETPGHHDNRPRSDDYTNDLLSALTALPKAVSRCGQ